MAWIDHLLMVIFGVLLPLRALQGARNGNMKKITFDTRNKKLLYYSNAAVLWGIALITMVTWWAMGRDLGQLGLEWGEQSTSPVSWGLLIVFLLLYLIEVWQEMSTAQRRDKTRLHFKSSIGFLPANAREFVHYCLLAVTAGVCEEIAFRGYFIRYLQWWFTDWPVTLGISLTLLLPAVSFGIAHFYQGWRAVVKIVAMAVLFGAFFLQTGTIWPLIMVHIIVDLIGGLLSWYLLDNELSREQERL